MSQVTKHTHTHKRRSPQQKLFITISDEIAVISSIFSYLEFLQDLRVNSIIIINCYEEDTNVVLLHNRSNQFSASFLSYRRMTRSNSVTTAVQADLDGPTDAPELPPRHFATMPRQYSRDAATSTVSIQGSGNHYHACAVDDYGEVGFDPSILPPPDPWMDSVPEPEVAGQEAVGRSVCPRDGRWFLKLLQAETERMEGWCRQMEHDEMENELPDESELSQRALMPRCEDKKSLLYNDISSPLLSDLECAGILGIRPQ